MIQLFGHAKCKATKAAQRFFSERGVKIQLIDIIQKNLSKGELQSVARAVGGHAALYDGDGPRARERGLHLLGPSEARIAELLLDDGRLYRTPIARHGQKATVGAAEEVWKLWVAEIKGG